MAAKRNTERPEDEKARRANSDGSIFYWDGRGWYAAITDTAGRRIMRKAPRQTEAGAEKLLRELLAQRDRGELTKGTKPLGCEAAGHGRSNPIVRRSRSTLSRRSEGCN
jgi:hypothetical protein